jgi:hypothetical protein
MPGSIDKNLTNDSPFAGDGTTVDDFELCGCHWSPADLKRMESLLLTAMPDGSTKIFGRTGGTPVSGSTITDFVTAYRALPFAEDPDLVEELRIDRRCNTLRVEVTIRSTTTRFHVEGRKRHETLGVSRDLRCAGLRVGGREQSVRLQPRDALLVGLAIPMIVSLAGSLAGVIPTGTLSLLLTITSTFGCAALGLLLSQAQARRRRTSISLLPTARAGRKPWTRTEIIAAASLAVALAGTIVTVLLRVR